MSPFDQWSITMGPFMKWKSSLLHVAEVPSTPRIWAFLPSLSLSSGCPRAILSKLVLHLDGFSRLFLTNRILADHIIKVIHANRSHFTQSYNVMLSSCIKRWALCSRPFIWVSLWSLSGQIIKGDTASASPFETRVPRVTLEPRLCGPTHHGPVDTRKVQV